ncbi:hypothetical protein SDC9_211335 [bioreactor metagenome]|uniref:Uncharacterized protein n=1 Tax=bioreactor metagenome TaxID=1076179 RepID=A0A645JIY9_9ZZZZ
MHVVVEQAGQYGSAFGVDGHDARRLRRGGDLFVAANGGDHAIPDEDGGMALAVFHGNHVCVYICNAVHLILRRNIYERSR